MKNAIINARVESELKTNVEAILKNLGLTATQAITIFYQQIKLNNGLPFEVKIPNDETVQAMQEALKGNVEPVTIETLRENLVHK
jgi:DNA-damage-inducible protein J